MYGTYYSDDAGSTWAQSASNIPIHDLAFDQNGILYGAFTGVSNSSGLYVSHDFGHTWNLENFIDNMNVIGIDVTGRLLTGFHSTVPPYQGIALYDTTSNNFNFINSGLPNLNINRIKVNPLMNSIAIFVCTDTAVYFSNDYYTSVQQNNFPDNSLNLYPNPANDIIEIESLENADIEILNLNGQLIKRIMALGSKTNVDISMLPKGVYFVKTRSDNKINVMKFIKI